MDRGYDGAVKVWCWLSVATLIVVLAEVLGQNSDDPDTRLVVWMAGAVMAYIGWLAQGGIADWLQRRRAIGEKQVGFPVLPLNTQKPTRPGPTIGTLPPSR